MFAAYEALLDVLHEREGFSEAMDLIEEQQAWRTCWPDLDALIAEYGDQSVGIMFYHSELAVVMSDRAAVLRSRSLQVEGTTALPPPPDVPQLTP